VTITGNGEALPLPPFDLRQQIGVTDLTDYDNPSGRLIYNAFPPGQPLRLPPEAYTAVFDFGCGCGRLTRQLLQQHPRPLLYVGIDLNREMVAWCNDNLAPLAPHYHFFHHDVYNFRFNKGDEKPDRLPFPVSDNDFTLLIAQNVFTELTESQAVHYLHEAARVLSPGGMLVSTWFLFDKREYPMMSVAENALYINDRDPSVAVIFDRQWLEATAAAIGLQITTLISPRKRGLESLIVMTPAGIATKSEEIPSHEARYALLPRGAAMHGSNTRERDEDGSSATVDGRVEAAGLRRDGVGTSEEVDSDRAALIRARIATVPVWYHQIDLGEGITTPGFNRSAEVLGWMDIPADCKGLRVLDVGARDGFFAFEFERRGAEVVAVDYLPRNETGFDVAAELLGSRVPYIEDNVYHLTPERYGTFDIVLFLGLLYHLPDPLGALNILRSVCRKTLYLETQVIDEAVLLADGSFTGLPPYLQDVPLAQFYPGNTLQGDHTNYWGPNIAGVRAMLWESNFATISQHQHGERALFLCECVWDPEIESYTRMARGRYRGEKLHGSRPMRYWLGRAFPRIGRKRGA